MKKLLPLLSLLFCAYMAKADTRLFINELMASNSSAYSNEVGEYEDWLEIYSDADTATDLAGYYITDNLTNLTKFRLPTTRACW